MVKFVILLVMSLMLVSCGVTDKQSVSETPVSTSVKSNVSTASTVPLSAISDNSGNSMPATDAIDEPQMPPESNTVQVR